MELFLASPHTIQKFRDGRRLALTLFGGGIPSIDENLLCRSNDGRKLEKRRYASDTLRGGFSYSELNENIHGRHSSMWGGQAEYYRDAILKHRPFILESFYYADATTEKLIPYFGDFLLDSGAFTFMQNSKTHVVWEDYIEKYADFINRNKVEKFFELDIDSVVGYDKVLEYRRKLEKLTNRACIPVWHISRGLQEFKKMCEEYDYVALGGIVGEKRGGTKYQQYHAAFPFFINEAHKKNVLIHGLGYTDLEGLKKYHFDSVDSTAWTTGNRFGYIYQFNGRTMVKHDVPKGKRLADSRKVAEINYLEWLKFQKWAINNL